MVGGRQAERRTEEATGEEPAAFFTSPISAYDSTYFPTWNIRTAPYPPHSPHLNRPAEPGAAETAPNIFLFFSFPPCKANGVLVYYSTEGPTRGKDNKDKERTTEGEQSHERTNQQNHDCPWG